MTGPTGKPDPRRQLIGVRLVLATLDGSQEDWTAALAGIGVWEMTKLIPALASLVAAFGIQGLGRERLAFELRQLEAGYSLEVGEPA